MTSTLSHFSNCLLKVISSHSSNPHVDVGLVAKADKQRLLSLQGSQLPLSKAEEVKCRMSQGRAPLFTDMRIVNGEGQELPWDGQAAGELQVRGPHVIRAYFKVTPHPSHSQGCR